MGLHPSPCIFYSAVLLLPSALAYILIDFMAKSQQKYS